MQQIVVSSELFADLIKRATTCDIIFALVEDGKGYLVGDIVAAVKGGKDDGSPDCKES